MCFQRHETIGRLNIVVCDVNPRLVVYERPEGLPYPKGVCHNSHDNQCHGRATAASLDWQHDSLRRLFLVHNEIRVFRDDGLVMVFDRETRVDGGGGGDVVMTGS